MDKIDLTLNEMFHDVDPDAPVQQTGFSNFEISDFGRIIPELMVSGIYFETYKQLYSSKDRDNMLSASAACYTSLFGEPPLGSTYVSFGFGTINQCDRCGTHLHPLNTVHYNLCDRCSADFNNKDDFNL